MLLPEWFSSAETAVKVAVIAAFASLATSLLTVFHSVFGAPLRYWLEKKALRNRLATEYEYQQRKDLRTLIGKYQGRMIEAAEAFNHRMWNFYANEGKGWLDVQQRYDQPGYYFKSWAYRLVNFLAVARQFEKEATFVDSRIAEKSDLEFIEYVKAFAWATCDVALFEGLDHDPSHQKDHLFRDVLRAVCDACFENGIFLDQDSVHQKLARPPCDALYRFLDGLTKAEDRLRWDRLVVLHLLALAFLNMFGYDIQRSSQEQFNEVSGQVRRDQVLLNLKTWLPKLGLAGQSGATIEKAIKYRTEVA